MTDRLVEDIKGRYEEYEGLFRICSKISDSELKGEQIRQSYLWEIQFYKC